MPDPSTVVAYCGLPPTPDAIWTRWRLDPVVLAVLFGWLALYFAGARRLAGTGRSRRELSLFVAGWLIATLALVSPLCPLSPASPLTPATPGKKFSSSRRRPSAKTLIY